MRKKILVDIYLAFNLGDDMFLDHLANQLPHVDFIPFHPGSNYDLFFSHYKNLKSFPYSFLDKIKARLGKNKLRDYKWMSDEYDGLLFLGGGIFREESYWKEVYSYRNEIINAFRKKDKPVWFSGCNFGPYHSAEFLRTYKSLFSQVNQITFRDKDSYELFKELKQVDYAPDLLWSYSYPDVKQENKYLGISVIDPRHKKGLENQLTTYLNSHLELINEYLSKGFKVSVFAFCETEGDMHIASYLKNKQPLIEVYRYSGNIQKYLMEIAKCSHFVASRFHANVISMHYNQNLIPVIYGDKTFSLLKDLNLEGIKVQEIERLKTIDFIKVNSDLLKKFKEEGNKHLNIGL